MTRIALWLAQYQLKSKKPALRLKALRRLRHAINNAVVALDEKITIALLDHVLVDPEVEIRQEAAGLLGDLRHVRTLPPLVRALNDASDEVQEIAIKGLKNLDDKSAITALVPKLSSGSTTIKWRAAQTLKSLGWQPATPAEEMHYRIALGEIKQLVDFGSAAVKPLLALLRSAPNDKKVAAINVLGEIADPEGFKPLQNSLRDADSFVRTAAIYALERANCQAAVPGLVTALKDSVRNVKLAAALALGSLGDVQAVEPLIKLLDHQDWELRRAALESLGKIGDKRAFPSVAKRLDDSDKEVREVAADALGTVGNESIVEKLVFTMVDAHSGVRQAAARALTRIYPHWEKSERVRRMLPEIQAATKHHNVSVQSAATSLFQLVSGPALDGSSLSLSAAAEPRESPAAAVLRQILNASEAEVRLAAVESIARMKLKDCAGDLKRLADDADEAVKRAARHAAATLATDAADAGVGKVTFLSKTPAAPVAEAMQNNLEDILICSSLGNVLHECKCRDLAGWLKLMEYIAPPAEQLGPLMSLGDFCRLDIFTPLSRLVLISTPEGSALLRIKTLPESKAVPEVAVASETTKAQATDWLRRTPSMHGVLLRGLWFPDQTIVCDVDSRDLTAAVLEQSYRLVADTFQWLLPRQVPATRLVWHYSRAALHCVRRGDKTILGVMATMKNNEADLADLNRQLADFQSAKF